MQTDDQTIPSLAAYYSMETGPMKSSQGEDSSNFLVINHSYEKV